MARGNHWQEFTNSRSDELATDENETSITHQAARQPIETAYYNALRREKSLR